jgi:hypothetical protein
MMATLDQVAIRTIFVHPNADPANLWPTHRLLADLGHEITSTSTLAEALRLMEEEEATDLLILEEPPTAEASLREEQLGQIRSLPPSQQPREVAIFSDRPKEFRSGRYAGAPRIHVLVKPLHMHGLLQVIRHLDARLPASAR